MPTRLRWRRRCGLRASGTPGASTFLRASTPARAADGAGRAPGPSTRRKAMTQAERMVNVGDTVNVGETERIVSAIAGGALTIWGLSRLSLGGLLVAGVGAALGYRAATGHCPVYEKLGIDAGGAHRNVGNLGVKIDESIVVNAP